MTRYIIVYCRGNHIYYEDCEIEAHDESEALAIFRQKALEEELEFGYKTFAIEIFEKEEWD